MSETETITLADGATCQEASPYSTAILSIPCGQRAVCVVQSNRDGEPALPMCHEHGDHSVKNRGFRYIVEPQSAETTALTILDTRALTAFYTEPGGIDAIVARIRDGAHLVERGDIIFVSARDGGTIRFVVSGARDGIIVESMKP